MVPRKKLILSSYWPQPPRADTPTTSYSLWCCAERWLLSSKRVGSPADYIQHHIHLKCEQLIRQCPSLTNVLLVGDLNGHWTGKGGAHGLKNGAMTMAGQIRYHWPVSRQVSISEPMVYRTQARQAPHQITFSPLVGTQASHSLPSTTSLAHFLPLSRLFPITYRSSVPSHS